MAIQEENSSSSLHFFKIILTETKLKLPSRFVKEHGNNLSDYARLRVPTRELTWLVEVKRDGRGVWLDKGWQDFVEYYSIKCAYFLVFRYEGESRFRVFIFDTTTSEIQYPVGSASTSRSRVELDQSKLVKFKEGDDDDDDDDDRCPQKLQKTGEVMRTRQSSNLKAQHFTSAVEKNVERAEALKSQNPRFIIRMQPFHVSDTKSRLYVPRSHSKSHFLEKGNNGIYLNIGEADSRAWFVKYYIAVSQRHQVCLHTSGWRIFMKENHLQVGDVCVFELVNSATMAYKVTIFRIADYA